MKLVLAKEAFLEEIQSTKNLSNKTITAYRSDLIDFYVFFEHGQLNDSTMLHYVKHLSQNRKLSDSTITRKLIVLKMFFEYLYQHNYIEKNYYQTRYFKFKKERKLPKTLEIKEISKLLTYVANQSINSRSSYEIWKS